VLVALSLACFAAAPQPPDDLPPVATPSTTQPVRFAFVDVTIDPKGTPLAAYQVEIVARDAARVKLAGVEGGDHAAFKTPPYYDPAALNGNRIILAAFNTAADLPRTPFRAARLHVQITGSDAAQFDAKLIVASAADGTAIPAARVSVSEGAGQ
jgi:hypothetical protein